MIENSNVNLLSERALYAIAYAEEEARLLGSGYVGTEHLLLGLLRDSECIASRALADLGVTWEAARDTVARGVGGERMGHVLLAMAPGELRAVAFAQYEAESAGHAYVGTHHLLLALTRDVPNVAMTVLGQQGIVEARLRQQVAATLERTDNPADDLAPALRRPMLASRARELLRAPRPGSYQASAPLTPPALPEERPVPSVRGVQWTSPSSSPERFDKFTERGRLVLSLAQEEAQRFNHNYIGTEHLLLGFLRIEDSTGMRVLRSIGVEPNRARSAVEFITGRGDRIVLGDIGLTPRAKKVIELAVDEARRLGHHYIGTEHLLLGMVREGEGIAGGVLQSVGVNLENARRHTIEVLSERGMAANPPTTAGPVPSPEQAAERARFDRFTQRTRVVLSLAQEEAMRLNHNYIGTEHLLLGLMREGNGVGAMVLKGQGVTLEAVRAKVEEIVGRGTYIPGGEGEIGMTPRARKVIELAGDQAQRLGHHYIGTEHLLLGVVHEGEGIAVQVLTSLGVNLENVRSISIQTITQAHHEPDPPPAPDAGISAGQSIPDDAPPPEEPPSPEEPQPPEE